MSDGADAGASGKRGSKPALAALRARALMLLASGEPQARVAEAVGQSLKTIQNLASEHADILRETAEKRVAAVVEAQASATTNAIEKIRKAAPEAADTLVELARSSTPDDRVRLEAAKAILDRGGVPITTKTEHALTSGGAGTSTAIHLTITDAVAGARGEEPKG